MFQWCINFFTSLSLLNKIRHALFISQDGRHVFYYHSNNHDGLFSIQMKSLSCKYSIGFSFGCITNPQFFFSIHKDGCLKSNAFIEDIIIYKVAFMMRFYALWQIDYIFQSLCLLLLWTSLSIMKINTNQLFKVCCK